VNKKRNTRVSNPACHIENTESIYQPRMLKICWLMLHSIVRLMWSILIDGMIMLIVHHMKRALQIKRNKLYSGKKLVIIVLAQRCLELFDC
jgi:hypothetical protein